MSIVVTGSIAFDNIMNFPGAFKDHILPEKVHILSVSFLVESLKKQDGGAAANVAYTLALLGERSRLLGAVGEDFDDYRTRLEGVGVDTTAVRVVPGEFTASAFITTDRDDNQITGFYPGAMREASALTLRDLPDVSLVVITPDAPDAMARYPQECRDLGIPYLYSPGQQIVSLTPAQLADGVRGAACVIGNDYEMEMVANKTGHRPEDLRRLAGMVITTLGDRGSRIAVGDDVTEIAPVVPREVIDPTGAGDAYVAGVALGLARGLAPRDFGRISALAAAHAISAYGTQSHGFTAETFTQECVARFGESLLSQA